MHAQLLYYRIIISQNTYRIGNGLKKHEMKKLSIKTSLIFVKRKKKLLHSNKQESKTVGLKKREIPKC